MTEGGHEKGGEKAGGGGGSFKMKEGGLGTRYGKNTGQEKDTPDNKGGSREIPVNG